MTANNRTRSSRVRKKRLLYVEDTEFGFWDATQFLVFISAGLILVYFVVQYLI
ncbi:hypothetical protein BH10ACI2_BH10ACI2_26370 [soil metagenome]